MKISIVAFDDFTDIDVFLMWDLLNRVKLDAWNVQIVGDKNQLISTTGIPISVHGNLENANDADVVLFSSGPGTRKKYKDRNYLCQFRLDQTKQMIGSMCSGSLILAALGLLKGREATTYPTTKILLETLGVKVVERPFVQNGNVATAAGCLAAQYLIGWVIEAKLGVAMRDKIIKSIQPVGEGLRFTDAASMELRPSTRQRLQSNI